MEVILREHVDNLGKRGDLVKVADGYARNYLLPRKLALLATEGNKKQIARERVKFDAKELEEKKVADAVADRLKAVEIEIARKVVLPEPLKALGESTIPVKIHRDVTAQVKVKIVPQKV